jgi:hypothetical protein
MRTDISLSQEASPEYRLKTNAAGMVTRYDQGSTHRRGTAAMQRYPNVASQIGERQLSGAVI